MPMSIPSPSEIYDRYPLWYAAEEEKKAAA
jgi:hypothetical protein